MVMDNSMDADQALQLKEVWDQNGQGTIYVGMGTTRFISAQFDPQLQQQPALFDPRVRQALTYALDRPAISETVQRGRGDLIANALLPPGDRLYDAVKDDFARYTYDAARARSMLSQLGWNPGGDGVLVGPDGRHFSVSLWTTEGSENEIAIIADYWKQIGVAAEQYIVPSARVRNREFRASYPGFETSARGSGDSILARVDGQQSAVARNNYSGGNRGHYMNPRLDDLIVRYRRSITERDQSQSIKAISDLLADDLPVMLLYYNPTTPGVRKGIRALEDFRAAAEASRLFGTFTRNAHDWEIL